MYWCGSVFWNLGETSWVEVTGELSIILVGHEAEIDYEGMHLVVWGYLDSMRQCLQRCGMVVCWGVEVYWFK